MLRSCTPVSPVGHNYTSGEMKLTDGLYGDVKVTSRRTSAPPTSRQIGGLAVGRDVKHRNGVNNGWLFSNSSCAHGISSGLTFRCERRIGRGIDRRDEMH